MCDALPGARCSSHVSKQMKTKEENIRQTKQKLRQLDTDIQTAYEHHDMKAVGELLDKQDNLSQKLRTLHDEFADTKMDFYTTPDGMQMLKDAISKESNPKHKSRLEKLLEQGSTTRSRQKHSLKLVQRNKKNLAKCNLENRLKFLKNAEKAYIDSYTQGKNTDEAEKRYRVAKDRMLLAEAGNLKAGALRTVSLKDTLRNKPENQDWSNYYVRVPSDSLVENRVEYFPYGNPLEKVSNVTQDGEGYTVELCNGEKVKSGELVIPVYPRTGSPNPQ